MTSAAAPTIRAYRGTTSSAFSRAHHSMSASRPCCRRFQPLRLACSPARARRTCRRAGSPRSPNRSRRRRAPGDPARAVRVVERELAEHARAEHRDVLPMRTRRRGDRVEVEQRADVDVLEPRRRRRRAAACRSSSRGRASGRAAGRRPRAASCRSRSPRSARGGAPPRAPPAPRWTASSRASSISAQQRTRS